MTTNNHKQHLYPTRIDMSVATRTQIVGLLNATPRIDKPDAQAPMLRAMALAALTARIAS